MFLFLQWGAYLVQIERVLCVHGMRLVNNNCSGKPRITTGTSAKKNEKKYEETSEPREKHLDRNCVKNKSLSYRQVCRLFTTPIYRNYGVKWKRRIAEPKRRSSVRLLSYQLTLWHWRYFFRCRVVKLPQCKRIELVCVSNNSSSSSNWWENCRNHKSWVYY